MKVLVGCEYSGIVRDAFIDAGHYAVSCDLLESESDKGEHIQGDVMDAIDSDDWDLIILHPPCTYLAVSGNRWYAGTEKRRDALQWTLSLWNRATAVAPMVALENPVGVISTQTTLGPATQYIQPWQFGHPETKKTGLWLEGLPPLVPTHFKPEVLEQRVWRMAPGPDRAKERSRFFPGIARAMAEQWTAAPFQYRWVDTVGWAIE